MMGLASLVIHPFPVPLPVFIFAFAGFFIFLSIAIYQAYKFGIPPLTAFLAIVMVLFTMAAISMTLYYFGIYVPGLTPMG